MKAMKSPQRMRLSPGLLCIGAVITGSVMANPLPSFSPISNSTDFHRSSLLSAAIEQAVMHAGQTRGWILEAKVPQLRQELLARVSPPFRVLVAPLGAQSPRSLVVWVESDQPNPAQRIPIQVAIRTYERVWVAQSDVPSGATIDSKVFSLEPREVAALQRRALTEQDGRSSWESRTQIRAGDVIYRDQVQRTPAVRKSETAWITLQTGRVSVQRQGRVEQDGWPGQSVRIQFANTHYSDVATVNRAGQLEYAQ
jgi:flagella basal body P-ring formation protein FlgA